MQIFNNPPKKTWASLCDRPRLAVDALDEKVKGILKQVKAEGDQALVDLTFQFDKIKIDSVALSTDQWNAAADTVAPELKDAIQIAARNIQKFHEAQKRDPLIMDTMPGVTCWRKGVGIDKVGIYIPGGTAPLFSTVLMLGIPARIAGCREIILCTPPNKEGEINNAILFAAKLVGVTQVFKVGGAQAIAAMAYGTESVPQVYKIFGPGNQYVTKAKQLVSEDGVAIDMPAGPSEVLVMADEKADPAFIAADLLSQAEHGPDSQVILLLDSNKLVNAIEKEVALQLENLPRKAIAEQALANSRIVILKEDRDCINFINAYAPEHLIINTRDPEAIGDSIINAGSVFLGSNTPEAAGDYASGTNHTLPTNGYAKAYAGVSLESFMKYITFQKISESGIEKLGPVVELMAEAEMLHAHKNAVTLRLNKIAKSKS